MSRVMSGTPELDLVRYDRSGPIVTLTLNAPPVNVLSRVVLDALSARLREVAADLEARVVILASGLDRAFAAGANIREMASMGPSEAREHGGRGQSLTRQIELLPLPVIAAVNGVCLGGGCEIALACDFIVASEEATFGQPEILLGVMPGWGGTRRLPRRIGPARARHWIYTGRSVPAREAEAQGLVFRVVPRSELLPAARALAEELATKPPVALAAAKYSVLTSLDPGIDPGLAYELDLWARLFGTTDQKQGMEAFLGKRSYLVGPRAEWDRASKGFPWTAGSKDSSSEPRSRRRSGKRKN